MKPHFSIKTVLIFTLLSWAQLCLGTPQSSAPKKSLTELVVVDSAWPLITKSGAGGQNVQILSPYSKLKAEQELLSVQVSTHSYLGAIIYNSGGIFVKNGWLRIWGAGSSLLPRAVGSWNTENKITGYLVVADDVIGGAFAINAGAFGPDVGNIYYFSPQSLEWEAMAVPYSHFIEWTFTKKIDDFYADVYWESWKKDVPGVSGDKSISVYPPMWAKGPALKARSLRAVSFKEQFFFQQDYSTSILRKRP